MPRFDWFILMGMGGFFILLGIIGIVWGKKEEKNYYNAIATRFDVREYMERRPEIPQPMALKIGGWIFIAVGIALLIMGFIF